MEFYIKNFSIILLFYFFYSFFFRKLKSKFYNNHQRLAGKKNIPLIGGIIILSTLIFNINNFNIITIYASALFILIGILSDANYLKSPKYRFLFQIIIIVFFLNFIDLRVTDLRFETHKDFLSNNLFKFCFTAFCLLILINGSNFIDGLNGLNTGYFILILSLLLLLQENNQLQLNELKIKVLLCCLLITYLLNLFNYLYLGDSGAYLLGFLVGTILIEVHNLNQNISPYFIALLLWYPSFENLFSIIRKKLNKQNPLKADTFHLHQMLFKYFKKKKILKNYINQLTAISLLFYNFIIFYLATFKIDKTNIMILLILLNIVVYLLLYFYLKIKLFKFNKKSFDHKN